MKVNIFLVGAEFFADALIIYSILHQRNQRPGNAKKARNMLQIKLKRLFFA